MTNEVAKDPFEIGPIATREERLARLEGDRLELVEQLGDDEQLLLTEHGQALVAAVLLGLDPAAPVTAGGAWPA